jgi:hypothetical protein
MLKLPSDTSLTDQLVAQLRVEHSHCSRRSHVPSISWCRVYPRDRPVTTRWAFASLPQDDVPRDALVQVGDISVFISPRDQQRMSGRTLDFMRGDGIVELARESI